MRLGTIFEYCKQMRRSLLAILLFVYTTVCAVGLPLTVYYCDGEFSGIGWQEQQDCCPVDDDCCENEYTVIKSNTAHAHPPLLKQPTLTCIWLPAENPFGYLYTAQPLQLGACRRQTISKSPPPEDIPILFSTFLI